jgi:glutamine synthetase
MAAIEGGQNKFKPGEPLDERTQSTMPGLASISAATLSTSLEALRNDHDYLTRGDVFTDDLVERWIECQNGRKANRENACP